MTTVGNILDYLETLAPRSMKMDWDNVGLLCGGRSRPVTKVLVALDPFEGVCREAKEWGAELIVTHHPLIFNPLKAVTDETALGRSIQLLCAAGISAVNAHTNLDCAPGGVNDCLAAALGLRDIRVIDPMGARRTGPGMGASADGHGGVPAPFRISATGKKRPALPGSSLCRWRQAGAPGSCGRRSLRQRMAGRIARRM